MAWKLKRVRQCDKCPWKVSTDPRDIPDGYCETKHRGLASTIAEPGAMPRGPGAAMSCHEHPIGDEAHCVGWLNHQIGVGNNLGLRIALMNCTNAHAIKVDGEQHETFEDTLPID
ncbi:hypothetical protein G6L37_06685 [Agrobacterium rubi]|nr:hypothetical protein [Agrobacterium rubi]NTF25050.1 hypothetical protein [Agrobacterium rubi]